MRSSAKIAARQGVFDAAAALRDRWRHDCHIDELVRAVKRVADSVDALDAATGPLRDSPRGPEGDGA